ncbi:MAG: flagellar filament capping protein FliD [Sphingomonas sp.]|uniref:flagellar filament capping protein FliD n=1 Tax=Sphingomonas sp. TaxID=28214 RepID=UPI0025E32AFE|nr:flagellar filament capping protein FliD [Sphingomonas sp.]MBX3562944.1 flagellar filament capping protein FliD [Sphingomonas sp.]
MAIESIAKTLGTGSGIDISSLVSQLVDAQYAAKNDALTKKAESLTAKISSAGEVKSNLTEFANALASLTSGTTLRTQPTSSNTGILNVTGLTGAKLQGLSANIEVRQLAQSQVASTDPFVDGATHDFGTGTLTLTFGTAAVSDGDMTSFTAGAAAPINIAIDSSHSTLAGVAQAINAANAGVTATIMTDGSGARLIVKGATGASQAFTLQGSGGTLADLDIGVGATGSTVNTNAQDAIVALDGVQTTRPTNSIYGLIEGVKVDLVSASIGTRVNIGTKAPTDAIKQTVTNFVDTYNQVYKIVKAAVDPISGPLRGDAAAKELLRSLKSITMSQLVDNPAEGTPASLSGIGVATQRDGTLSVDNNRLQNVLTNYPSQIEAMFAASAGITKVMSAISDKAISRVTGLGASEQTYTKQQSDVAEDREDALAAAEKLRTRMTRQFAAMDSRVAAYKSTQSFLTNQIAAWNKSS